MKVPTVRSVTVRIGLFRYVQGGTCCKKRYCGTYSGTVPGVWASRSPVTDHGSRGPPPRDHDTMCHELLDGNGSSTMCLLCAAFKKGRHGHDLIPGSYELWNLLFTSLSLCLCSHCHLACSHRQRHLPLAAFSPSVLQHAPLKFPLWASTCC